MLDWDMNHHLFYKLLIKIIFQISTMMHETWIGTKNCQIVTILCVDCSFANTPKWTKFTPLSIFEQVV